MGQYYSLACPEAGTHLNAHNVDAFIKAYEQIWSSGVPAALAFLTSAGRGAHPRDLPWAPQGDWAGRMVLMTGDYAENGDLRGREDCMGMPEEDLYGTTDERTSVLGKGPRRRKKLQDLSDAFLPIFERTHGLRTDNLHADGTRAEDAGGFRRMIPTTRQANGIWGLDLSGVEPQDRDREREYYERLGAFRNTAWQRPPLQVNPAQHFEPAAANIPDEIPGEKEGQGGHMLWVNLDRREFVDPATLGDVPDLVGVMQGLSARAVLGMLVHHQRRGGGDLGDLGPLTVAGRWRGDRIVLMGPEGFKPGRAAHIGQEEVRRDFVDISGNAHAFIECIEIFGTENMLHDGEAGTTLNDVQKKVLSIAMEAPAIRKAFSNGEVAAGHVLSAVFVPAMVVEASLPGEKKIKAPLQIAPSFDLYLDEGKIWLPEDIQARIAPLLSGQAPQPARIRKAGTGTRGNKSVHIDVSGMTATHASSSHELIAALQPAA